MCYRSLGNVFEYIVFTSTCSKVFSRTVQIPYNSPLIDKIIYHPSVDVRINAEKNEKSH